MGFPFRKCRACFLPVSDSPSAQGYTLWVLSPDAGAVAGTGGMLGPGSAELGVFCENGSVPGVAAALLEGALL